MKWLLALAAIALACVGPACDYGATQPRVDSLVIDFGSIAAGREATLGTARVDASSVVSSAGLPLYHYGAVRTARIHASGVAPSAGVLRTGVYLRDDRPWAIIATIPLTAGEALPEEDLLSLYETEASNGVSGSDLLRRSLADIAYGGYPTQYPDFELVLAFEWTPQAGGEPTMLLSDVRVDAEVVAPVDLYGVGP